MPAIKLYPIQVLVSNKISTPRGWGWCNQQGYYGVSGTGSFIQSTRCIWRLATRSLFLSLLEFLVVVADQLHQSSIECRKQLWQLVLSILPPRRDWIFWFRSTCGWLTAEDRWWFSFLNGRLRQTVGSDHTAGTTLFGNLYPGRNTMNMHSTKNGETHSMDLP